MSMKKRLLIPTVSVLAAALLAVGGTLAYFTAKDEVTNVVNMGNVKISLSEPKFEIGNPGRTADKVVPGTTLNKDPTVKNIGANDCYVRMKVDVNVEKSGQPEDKAAAGWPFPVLISTEYFKYDVRKWHYNKEDGYFYYQDILRAGSEDTAVLFQAFTIPTKWGNEYADATVKVNITAEAVQAENFKPGKLIPVLGPINSWPDVTPEA